DLAWLSQAAPGSGAGSRCLAECRAAGRVLRPAGREQRGIAMSIGHLAAGVALMSGLAGTGAAAPSPQQLFDQMSARFNGISDYEVVVDSTARQGSGLKERRYRFDFKKPGMVRLRTLSGENKDGELCVRPDGRIRG